MLFSIPAVVVVTANAGAPGATDVKEPAVPGRGCNGLLPVGCLSSMEGKLFLSKGFIKINLELEANDFSTSQFLERRSILVLFWLIVLRVGEEDVGRGGKSLLLLLLLLLPMFCAVNGPSFQVCMEVLCFN